MSEIEIHIHTEDDVVHRVDAPTDLSVEEFLKELVELLKLSPALPWSLYVKRSGQTLDPVRTFQESGVVNGEHLFLSSKNNQPALVPCKHCGAGCVPGSKFCRTCGKPLAETPSPTRREDIQLHLYTPTGQKHSVRVAPDMSTEEFTGTLVSDLALDLKDSNDQIIQWGLYDKDSSRMLDPAKSLVENGLVDGHHLYIRAIEVEVVKVEVYTPNGDHQTKSVPAATPTREFIQNLEKDFSLQGVELFDKDTSKSLHPSRTLKENGVASEHHLYMRIRQVVPIPWVKIAGVAAGVLLFALVSYAGYRAFVNRPPQLSPAKVSLTAGQTQQFTVTVRGGNPPVAWSLSPEIGRISDSGLYTAPRVIRSPEHVQVIATTQTNPAKSVAAEISLERENVVSRLAITPDTATLGAGDSQKFTVAVDGQETSAATWSLDPNVGQIAPDGTYTAPSPIPSEQTVTIRATGGENSAAAGSATIALKPLSISLRTPRATLFASERVILHATVTGSSNTNVRWALTGPGYVSPNGTYFAPAQIPAEQAVTITAISGIDPTKSAGVEIELKPTVTVNLTPLGIQLGAGARQQFFAEVSGSTNRAVRWSLMGPGTLSNDGSYTAPASIASEENVQITATSMAQPSKSATATVSLFPLSISIAPANATLRAAESQPFHAAVKGGETRVLWRVVSGPGQITASGVYTAPPFLKTDEAAEVMAYCSADPSKRAMAVLKLVGYHGPMAGGMLWSGQIPKGETFTVEGTTASAGTVKGLQLPGIPVVVSLSSKDFTLIEGPGPGNGYARVTIRSEKGKKANLGIGWTVRQQ